MQVFVWGLIISCDTIVSFSSAAESICVAEKRQKAIRNGRHRISFIEQTSGNYLKSVYKFNMLTPSLQGRGNSTPLSLEGRGQG
jgi:hypothetical protein